MENEKVIEIISETVKELVFKIGIEVEVEIKEISQGERSTIVCNIKTEESSYLIGQYGINLSALQHVARIMVKKKIEDKINFILDVNSYRQEKNKSVAELAKSSADRAILEKKAVALRPMSSYERRLVHMELSGWDDIKTESIGEGEDRRVVIKPIGLDL